MTEFVYRSDATKCLFRPLFILVTYLLVASSAWGDSQAKELKDLRKVATDEDFYGKYHSAMAQNELGVKYYKGDNYSEAVKWFRKAAENGKAEAQNNLGVMYYYGYGVKKDPKEAKKWFEKAANQEHAEAQYGLGEMYANGYGVSKNDSMAVEWFRKAANQEHAEAQYNLGEMYANGLGVKKDPKEAKKWFEKAANQFRKAADEKEDANAQYRLGVMYANGQGVNKDPKKAKDWFDKATTKKEDADALYRLGEMYANGLGVEQNYDEAAKRFREAAQRDTNVQELSEMYGNSGNVWQDDVTMECDSKAIDDTTADYTKMNLPPGAIARLGKGQAQEIALRDSMTKIGHMDPRSRRKIAMLRDYGGPVTSVAFSPVRALLASGCRDSTIKLWHVKSGVQIFTLKHHTDAVTSVAFSPDGALLASGSKDGIIKIWHVNKCLESDSLKAHDGGPVISVAFSPDGALLASGTGKTDSMYKLWDVDSGKIKNRNESHPEFIRGNKYNSYKPNQEQSLKSPDLELLKNVFSVFFLDKKTLLASNGDDNMIRLWNMDSKQTIARLIGDVGDASSMSFFHDIAASGGKDGTVTLWSISSHRPITTLKGHVDNVSSVAFSPDGKLLASGSEDGTVLLWSLHSRVAKQSK